mgnify:FL=1
MSEIVYILQNPFMPDIVKIGRTDRALEDRMRELYNTSVPVPFECYFAVELDDSKDIENLLHQAFDDLRVNNSREFFKLSPENARVLLERFGTEVQIGEVDIPNEDKKALDRAVSDARAIREAFNFHMVDIKPGSELTFLRDENEKAIVLDRKKIKHRDQETSLSAAALLLLNEMGSTRTTVAGPYFWKYEGEILSDLRNRLERE